MAPKAGALLARLKRNWANSEPLALCVAKFPAVAQTVRLIFVLFAFSPLFYNISLLFLEHSNLNFQKFPPIFGSNEVRCLPLKAAFINKMFAFARYGRAFGRQPARSVRDPLDCLARSDAIKRNTCSTLAARF